MNKINIEQELKLFNDVVRYAYNRFHDDTTLKEKDIRIKCNEHFKGKLNSWLIQCALREAVAIQKRNKDKKVIFGGKSLLKRYLKNLIDKETYKKEKLSPLSSQGEMLSRGNRMFDFDFNNQMVILKLSRNNHIEIKLGKLHRRLQNELNALQELCINKQATCSIKLNEKYIWFTYDEKLVSENLKFKELKETRVLGIDLNPSYIGLSILEFGDKEDFEVIHKQVFDLKQLTNKKISSNKRKHELIELCYKINKLIDFYKCKKLCVEDLNIKSSNKGSGKEFNRLCNNVWNRNLVVNKLKMLSNIYGFELIEVNPCYSSFIGNILYGNETTPDMIAAAIEIARRGYKKYEKEWFYPAFNIESLDEQWKQTLAGVQSWKEAFKKIKNLELKYRVQLLDILQNAVFSKFNHKSKVYLYIF